jgi:uncharacterized protein
VPAILIDAGPLTALLNPREAHYNCRVFTIDSDFHIYRRQGNKVIPLLMPPD